MKRIIAVLVLVFVASFAGLMIAETSRSTVKAEVDNGVISIVFDDNYLNQYEQAFPLMQTYGIGGTFYVRTDKIDQPGYMSAEQLRSLENAGNEIGSHSHTHRTFTSLSEAEIRYECETSKQILEQEGLTVSNFAYPNGPSNDFVDSIVSEYYRSGRTAYVEPYVMDAPTTQFRVAGFSAETGDSTALSLLKGMVDQVYSSNGWAIIFFHNIIQNGQSQPYTTSTEYFESFLNYIIAKGVQTLTVNQVLDIPILEPTSFSINSNYGTVTPTSGIYNLSETLTIQAFAPQAGDGERYVWLGWTGSGNGSYTGTSNPATVTLNGPVNQTALWRHEFKLSTFTDNGYTSPSVGDHWYENGTIVTVEAFAPTAISGERYIFNSWTGTGSGSYSGSSISASIVMNESTTQTASWVHQYQISVGSSGVGSDFSDNLITVDGTSYKKDVSFWYNEGSSHSFMFPSQLEDSSDKRYVWVSSSGLSTQQSGSITITESGTLEANYKSQFFVNVSSPYGAISGSGWYDFGETAYAALDQSIVNAQSGIRHVFIGWSEGASGISLVSDLITVDGPKSAVASWQKQFLVTFDQTGLPSNQNGSIQVDLKNHELPFSVWVDEGTNINYAYPDFLQDELGTRYVLTYPPSNKSSIEVNSPVTVVGRYDVEPPQYDVKPLVAIIAASTVVILLIAFVLLRKR
jgi:peptidoglycan/xylan/chitin deacetylase (PgdA/CDA1 family)